MHLKTTISVIIFLAINFSINAQKSYVVKSKDGKVSAEKFISFDEGVDSLILKNKKHKFKFSYLDPFIKIKDDEGYGLLSGNLVVHRIKKIKKNIYLIIGFAGNLSVETELHLLFVKKNKILKYYVLKSDDKMLRDVFYEYLPKTKEIIIPISRRYTPQDYLYDIELENRSSFDTIRPMVEKKSDSLFYHYKLKIK